MPFQYHLCRSGSVTFVAFLAVTLFTNNLRAQNFPSEYKLSEDGRILTRGSETPSGLYDPTIVREVRIDFPQTNYWSLMEVNYETETEIPASLTMDGVTYDSVGVRFRGNTSYFTIGSSQKKSFAVATDFVHEDQRIMGYNNLKFNNAHEDASFMREVVYNRMAKKYTPIAKANYIHLFLNNTSWGVYPNIQSVDKSFLEDWFLSNDGARWRATVEDGGFGGGPGWGDGTAGMNYLGADTTEYQEYYDLKSSDIEDEWTKLVNACQVLSTANANNKETVANTLDIDKILWFLAVENIWADDDSYVMKGKMDYYVYYEPETGLTFPLEFDGNSSFHTQSATSWTPFKNVNNANYPLLNKLLNIPEWRQRYLAHYRTILNETFTTENASAIIDSIDAQIRSLVTADTKKLYSNSQYTQNITALKNFVTNRRNYLLNNAEVKQVAPQILSANYTNPQGELYTAPKEGEEAFVTTQVSSTEGISKVNLYYDDGLIGNFRVVEMADDGLHQDGIAADGIYGGNIPGFDAGTLIRFYIEAISANAQLSASYLPQGAEHDVFVYMVQHGSNLNGVVINEIMASNMTGAVDDAGDHADWVELYNTTSAPVDLSGFYFSDDADELQKWPFPAGTILNPDSYLILWADDEEEEGPFHLSFKVSASGETVTLSDGNGNIADQVAFGIQTTDVAYARVPNGTGPFINQPPTFNAHNSPTSTENGLTIHDLNVYPNPFDDDMTISIDEEFIGTDYMISDLAGRILQTGTLDQTLNTVDAAALSAGYYVLVLNLHQPLALKLVKL